MNLLFCEFVNDCSDLDLFFAKLISFLFGWISVYGIDITSLDCCLLRLMGMKFCFPLGMNHHRLVIHLFYLQLKSPLFRIKIAITEK